jgi:hypothetical protein
VVGGSCKTSPGKSTRPYPKNKLKAKGGIAQVIEYLSSKTLSSNLGTAEKKKKEI